MKANATEIKQYIILANNETNLLNTSHMLFSNISHLQKGSKKALIQVLGDKFSTQLNAAKL